MKFREALDNFVAVQKEFREFGAYDTEPRCVFQDLIYTALSRGAADIAIPDTVRGWQLYSTMRGSAKAARALGVAARIAVKAAPGDPDAVFYNDHGFLPKREELE